MPSNDLVLTTETDFRYSGEVKMERLLASIKKRTKEREVRRVVRASGTCLCAPKTIVAFRDLSVKYIAVTHYSVLEMVLGEIPTGINKSECKDSMENMK